TAGRSPTSRRRAGFRRSAATSASPPPPSCASATNCCRSATSRRMMNCGWAEARITPARAGGSRRRFRSGRSDRVNKPVSNRETMVVEALGDLRKCLEFADDLGDVEYIDGADPELEIGALYEISLQEEKPPILMFRNIKGYPAGHRLAMNVRASKVFDGG